MQVISSNLVSLNADSAMSCSSAFAFECHARISTSNQQLMHRTKSRPTFFFSESFIFHLDVQNNTEEKIFESLQVYDS